MGSTPNVNPPASSAVVRATVYCDPLREGTIRRGENSESERREQVECVPARTEAELYGGFDRRLALERTWEPGEASGVILEEGGAVREITAAGGKGPEPEWRCAMAKKFFSQGGGDLQKNGTSVAIATSGASRYSCAYSGPQAACWLRASSFGRAARISSDARTGTNWPTTGRGTQPNRSER